MIRWELSSSQALLSSWPWRQFVFSGDTPDLRQWGKVKKCHLPWDFITFIFILSQMVVIGIAGLIACFPIGRSCKVLNWPLTIELTIDQTWNSFTLLQILLLAKFEKPPVVKLWICCINTRSHLTRRLFETTKKQPQFRFSWINFMVNNMLWPLTIELTIDHWIDHWPNMK